MCTATNKCTYVVNIKAKYEIGKLRSTIEISRGMSARKRNEHQKKSDRQRERECVCFTRNRQWEPWQKGEVRPKMCAYFMYEINAEDTHANELNT